MKIIVYGVGGVGGYFGGRLAQAENDVTFVARGDHLTALRTSGLIVESTLGNFHLPDIQAVDDVRVCEVPDLVILGVKAWQVPKAALDLVPVVGTNTIILPLQNGIDAPSQLTSVFGENAVLGGLCQISAFKAGAGHIRHVGIEPLIAFGELNGLPSPRVESLRQVFSSAGIKVEIPANIYSAMWRKFLFIASISGIGAVTRSSPVITRKVPQTRKLLENAMQEIQELARIRQVHLDGDIIQRTMAFIDQMSAAVMPSMQRDIMEGRPSELEAQSGAVVRMAHEGGISTPTHAFIYAALLPQELEARQRYGID